MQNFQVKAKSFSNQQIALNMFFSIIAFALNSVINIVITPIITANYGSAAYGYTKLANDFTSYANLITVALNSMSSRYIMLERTQKNYSEANIIFSSVAMGNLIISGILILPTIFMVIFIDSLIAIPDNLIIEVKIILALTFINYILNLIFSVYGNCYYLTNRLDINSKRNMISSILRVTVIFIIFYLFSPKPSVVALAGVVATIYLIISNLYYSKKLTPDLKVRASLLNWSKIKILISSGIWNSITRLSQIFSSGLDLLVTNVLIGAKTMGYLSIAKIIPTFITNFNTIVSEAFSPNLMYLYAKNDLEGLKKSAQTAMRFMCLFTSIPNAMLIIIGKNFFSLWVPGEPINLIHVLSVITLLNSCIIGPIQPLYQIFTIVNKVKESAIVNIIYGFSSIVLTFLSIKFLNLGVYAVAGVSFTGSVLVALFYHVPFAAKYVGLPKKTFYPIIFMNIVSLIIGCVITLIIKNLFTTNSWFGWIVCAGISCILSFAINMFIVLNKQERKLLLNKILKRE